MTNKKWTYSRLRREGVFIGEVEGVLYYLVKLNADDIRIAFFKITKKKEARRVTEYEKNKVIDYFRNSSNTLNIIMILKEQIDNNNNIKARLIQKIRNKNIEV